MNCKHATRSVITSRSKRLQEYPTCGPLTMHHHGLKGIATPNHGTRTHLWLEVYYKLPPSAAVPMRTEKRAKAKSEATDSFRASNPAATAEALTHQ